jgi:signal transduction histidine kinase
MTSRDREPATAADLMPAGMQARRHREIMAAFGCKALQSTDLDELLAQAAVHVAEGLGVRRAKVLEYRRESDDLLVRAGVGWKEGVVGQVHLEAGMASPPGRAFRTGEAVFIEDLPNATEFEYSHLLREHGIVALVNVPIRFDEFTFGVLEADSEEQRRFSEDDKNFVLGFANLLAAAVHRKQAEVATADAAEVREQLLAELRQAKAAAEEAAQAKAQFLAAAAHDLKQPVQVIMICLDSISERSDTGTRKRIRRAQLAVARLDRVLDRMLALASLESGALQPREEVFPLADLLANVAEQFRDAAEQKGIELRVVPTTVRVRSDPDLLSAILQNLVGNAVKYTDRGGVLVGCRRRGGRAIIEIHDTGPGIPADQLTNIFEEFRRLDPTRGEGLGLGLSIVHRFAAILGHRVGVQSRVGKGSCFGIEVDIDGGPSAAPGSFQKETCRACSERVMPI